MSCEEWQSEENKAIRGRMWASPFVTMEIPTMVRVPQETRLLRKHLAVFLCQAAEPKQWGCLEN